MSPPTVVNSSGIGSNYQDAPVSSITTTLNCSGSENGSIYVCTFNAQETATVSDPTNGNYAIIPPGYLTSNSNLQVWYKDNVSMEQLSYQS